MHSFELHIPTKIFFGQDKAVEFSEELKNLGSHALLVIGGGSVVRLGYLDIVTELLDDQQIKYSLFRGIEPNPHAKTINKAAKEGQDAGVDFVLALGGGSVMDASKAISGLIYENEEEIWPYVLGEEKYKQMSGALPIACIPTTAATASEVTAGAVISNPAVQGKSVVGYSFFRSSASWLNPSFHTDLPLTTTRDGAADILSHVFENYLLGGNDAPLTDRYCENIMTEVMDLLPEITEDPKNKELRGRMLWASTLALNGMQGVGRERTPFPMHSLEHALSGYNSELAHGRGLATIFPAYFRWLWERDRSRDRLSLLGHKIYGESLDQPKFAGLTFISRFENWLKENELYQRLSDVGIPESAYESIAEYALKTYGDGDKIDARGPLTKRDIIEIFRKTENQTVEYNQKKTI